MAIMPPQAKEFARSYKTAAGQSKATGQQPSFLLYFGMMMIALLKDLLDLTGLGSLPGIGTVVTACFAFLIWMLMTLFDHSGGKSNNKVARSLVLMGFSLVEAIGFGLNFLPVETCTVFALYMMARASWKKEEKRLTEEEQANTNEEQSRAYRMQAQIAQAQEEAQEEEAESANDLAYQNAARKML